MSGWIINTCTIIFLEPSVGRMNFFYDFIYKFPFKFYKIIFTQIFTQIFVRIFTQTMFKNRDDIIATAIEA